MTTRRKLGGELEVFPDGLGCMGMSFAYGRQDEADAIRTRHRAVELGVECFYTAERYGRFTNEVLVGLPDGGPLDRIEVSDVAGRVLRVHGPSIATPQRISLEGLDPGTYLVRVARAGRTSSRKLVVQ